ncbi:reverse transcriptase [Tanacetum coccineum]
MIDKCVRLESFKKGVKYTYLKLLEQEDERQTNTYLVMSSSSIAEKRFIDLFELLKELPRDRLDQTITFIKEEGQCMKKNKRDVSLMVGMLLSEPESLKKRCDHGSQSFHGVKELVRKGCKWNIGNGHSVNVWEDYWLEDHRSLGHKPDNCEVIYVRDLLNVDGDDWNRELLISLFPNNVVNKITSCFVNHLRPDTLYWLNSPDGHFSSKVAYFLALDSADGIEQHTTQERIKLWRALWKANVPNKIKLFVWRALHNYLPSLENMQIRGLTLTSLTCTLSGEFGEDVMHILYRCSMAKEVWTRAGFGYLYERNHPDTLDEFCWMILENSSVSWETYIMILWGLWTRRNKHFQGQHDGRDQEVDVVVKRILAEYHLANQKERSRAESGKMGLGFVARNHNGEVLLSGARGECFASSPLEAEAKAIFSCQWSFVKRQGNKVAHSIAAWVVGCNNEIVLEVRVPDCALECVMEDVRFVL